MVRILRYIIFWLGFLWLGCVRTVTRILNAAPRRIVGLPVGQVISRCRLLPQPLIRAALTALLLAVLASTAWQGIAHAATFTDTFVDTNGTLLTAHTPSGGGSWTKNSAFSAGNIQIQSNVAVGYQTSASGVLYASFVPAGSDYEIFATGKSYNNALQNFPSLCVCMATNADTMYLLEYVPSSSNWQLNRHNAGTNTTLATGGAVLADGSVYKFRRTVDGSGNIVLTGYKDGVSFLTFTDTSGSKLSTAGRAGLLIYDSLLGQGWTNLTIQDLASSSFTITPSTIYTNNTNVSLALVGTGTAWTSSTTWTPSAVTGLTFVSKAFTDATHYTVVVSTTTGTGTATLTEGVTGTAATTFTVSQATFTRSPTSITVSTTGNVITLVGTGTNWTGSPFSLTGGTGASITAQSVSTTTAATVTLTAGSTTGPLTITDADGNSVTVTVAAAAILADAASIYYSPGTVRINSGTHAAWFVENGPYMKFNFSGTSLTFNVDLSVYRANSIAAAAWGKWVVSIDGGAWATKSITDPGGVIATQSVTMASSLTNTTHSCVVWWVRGTETDMWTPTQALGLSTITLASGSDVLSSPTGAAAVYSRKIMVFGDSITTGYRAYNPDSTISIFGPASYGAILGKALGAEVGIVGYSAQGWSTGGSGAPSLTNSWKKYDTANNRVFPTLDAVFFDEGTNDGATDVTATVLAHITAARTQLGPNTWIIYCPAFSGTGAAFQKAAVASYQASNPTDLKVACISVADYMSIAAYTANVDGVHPDGPGHAMIGATIAARAWALPNFLVTASGTKRKVQ